MSERNGQPAVEKLSERIDDLSQQVEVLRNVLDEIRVDFAWAVQNHRVSIQAQPFILKRMAADPAAKDWSKRLEIVGGGESSTGQGVDQVVGDVAALATQAGDVCGQLERVRDELARSIEQPTAFPPPSSIASEPMPTTHQPVRQGSLFGDDDKGPAMTDVVSQGKGNDTETVSDEPAAFLRPDRQDNFCGQAFYEWPSATEDRNTITVDRVGDNGDGGPHRFTIIRGDTVEAFFSKHKQEIGTVVGISHAQQQVRVRFRDGSEGTWFAVGSIYPAVDVGREPNGDSVPLSETIAHFNETPQEKGWTEEDRVPASAVEISTPPQDLDNELPLCTHDSSSPDNGDASFRDSHNKGVESLTDHHRPYTLDEYRQFRQQLQSGAIDAKALGEAFEHLVESRESFTSQLVADRNAQQLKNLASRLGCWDARRQNKQQNADAIYRSLMQSFALGRSVMYQPLAGESYQDAVRKVVESLSDNDIETYRAELEAEDAKDKKAIENPETLEEFRQFAARKGEDVLTAEQLIAFDRLRADQTRKQRSDRKPATVEQFAGDVADLQITIKEGYHTRQQIPLWICQLSHRIDRTTYNDLKIKASQLGGWWSSFRKDDAGFQFKNEESAKKFQSLLEENADRTDELAERKTRTKETASSRLIELAHDLETRAEETLSQDRLTNTVRRSEMAAGMRGRAYAEQAFAGTMQSLAVDLATGKAVYLDGIRTKTQLSTLIYILRRGKTKRNEQLLADRGELGMWDRHLAAEDLDNRPLEIEDASFAAYPFPSVYKRHLQEAVTMAANRKGVKQRAQKMSKWIHDDDREFVDFSQEYEVEALADFCSRCNAAGVDVQWLGRSMDDYNRLRRANIYTLPELRVALRELVPHLVKKREDDPILRAEQALVGRKIDGFFPTPKAVISRMLELADIQPMHNVLEPSAGKGDILDMLRTHHPDANVTAVEMNGTLFDVLEAKGHQVERGDFLDHQPVSFYDRIVMNPPFENGVDIEHVRRAYDQLIAGGKLVAIMSEGPFFRQDRKATDFRQWFDDHDGGSEQLPDDAFKTSEAFRTTGVRTRIVQLSK